MRPGGELGGGKPPDKSSFLKSNQGLQGKSNNNAGNKNTGRNQAAGGGKGKGKPKPSWNREMGSPSTDGERLLANLGRQSTDHNLKESKDLTQASIDQTVNEVCM